MKINLEPFLPQYPQYYPTVYRDAYGEEQTTLINDGKGFSMVVRGVEFSGEAFDYFDIPVSRNSPGGALFPFSPFPVGVFLNDKPVVDDAGQFVKTIGWDFGYSLEFAIPVVIVVNGEPFSTFLKIYDPFFRQNPGESTEPTQLEFTYVGFSLKYKCSDCDVYDAIFGLQTCLPENIFLCTCSTCAYAFSNPFGSVIFSDVACFRGVKEEFLEVKKSAKWRRSVYPIMDKVTEYVQATYLCPEFELGTSHEIYAPWMSPEQWQSYISEIRKRGVE